MSLQKSAALFEAAKRDIPGGVNSPVRAFQAVKGQPIFFQRAQGAYLFDVDGNRYIDYVNSWGPMILGHNHPAVVSALTTQLQQALSFGAPCELEVDMARTLCELMPSLEQVRMVSSGTEATMSAVRLARAFTERTLIAKFEGCYHGHADSFLIKAGSGALTLGTPSSPGVPKAIAEQTAVLPYNDIAAMQTFFAQRGEQLAAVIVEPVAGNMNCVLPESGFLQTLRALCTQYQCLLIFDEVMTGFRVAQGGAQAYYQITPDLTCLGKVIGGGMPVGAFGGRRDIMALLAPLGPVYQAGTLSGHPLAMAAGLATLSMLKQPAVYQQLQEKTQQLTQGLVQVAQERGIAFTTNHVGSMFGLFFTAAPKITSYPQAVACNERLFRAFFHGMLKAGVYFAPSRFEAGFVSLALSDNDIADTLEIANNVMKTLQ